MAVYAIGDVQGCFDELQKLLTTIDFNTDKDRLWFCGDLVNRGPKSLETLQFIHSIKDNCVIVLGNHDLHLLATYYHHKKPGRKDTLDAFMDNDSCAPLMDWLRQQPLIHHDAELDVTLIHAGIHPDWTIEHAMALANEVEQVIRGEDHIGFYQHMYGDKPHFWSEKLTGWSRLRYITNILTRLRYMDSKNKVCLSAKSAPDSTSRGNIPWFDIPGRATANQRILFGHWSTLALIERDYESVFPLDCGCLWGGKLMARRIDEEGFPITTIDCIQQQSPV